MNHRDTATPVRRPNLKHGAYTLRKAVQTLGSRALPPRSTALGRALHDWRTALVADLGGEDAVSTQQLALVELAVRTKLLVDSVDAFVLGMGSPVNKRRRCLHPVVRERQALVNQLQGRLAEEWTAACARAGVPQGWARDGYVFHNTRHSAVTNMSAAGIPDTVATSITGHRTLLTYKRYGIRQESVQRAALEKVEGYVQGITGADTERDEKATG